MAGSQGGGSPKRAADDFFRSPLWHPCLVSAVLCEFGTVWLIQTFILAKVKVSWVSLVESPTQAAGPCPSPQPFVCCVWTDLLPRHLLCSEQGSCWGGEPCHTGLSCSYMFFTTWVGRSCTLLDAWCLCSEDFTCFRIAEVCAGENQMLDR